MRLAAGLTLAVVLALALPIRGDDTKDFFTGKDLSGWQGLDKHWSVRDGTIVGTTEPDGIKFNTFLCSRKEYKDFELSFKVRLKGGKGNSGVQIRSEVFDKDKLAVKGPQCDIGAVYWGSLYGENFGGMMQEADKETVKKVLKPDDFNDYHIKCAGKRVTIKLNGTTTVDADFAKLPDKGIIAWQIHGGGPMEVIFKDIVFKELK